MGSQVAVDYVLLSTTTSLGRVRGFTIKLLFHLKDGPLRLHELCQRTEKYPQYVNRYLNNMQKYGFVEKKEVFWNLTILGADFISYLEKTGKYSIVSRKLYERNKKEIRKLYESSARKRLKQLRFDLWLQNSRLNDTEKEVVEALMKHYNETGSKFILVKNQYELAEKLRKHSETLTHALKNLVQDNIIYLYHYKTMGYWKIGLKKAFLELLQDETTSVEEYSKLKHVMPLE
jgi:DNA-binding HxlR family transcriptional regulator